MERLIEYAGNHPLLAGGFVLALIAALVYELRRGATGVTQVSTADAVRLVNRGAAVLDVRDKAQYDAGHIVDARHAPLAELTADPEKLAKLRTKPVVAVCETGHQSARAAGALRKAGFEKAFSLRGGLNAWRQENLPLVRSD